MDDDAFDAALVSGAFTVAVLRGWGQVTVAAAAREAGLDLARARVRAPATPVLLLRFGQMLDQAALRAASVTGSPREKLFDMLMGRFDAMHANRDGVLALFAALPYQPGLSLMLLSATRRSMGWLVDAAELDVSGFRRAAVVRGLVGVWLYALRAWEKDDSPDMTATMAAVDKALDRASQLSRSLGFTRSPDPAEIDPVVDPTGLAPDVAPGLAPDVAPGLAPDVAPVVAPGSTPEPGASAMSTDAAAEANMDAAAQIPPSPSSDPASGVLTAADAARAFDPPPKD